MIKNQRGGLNKNLIYRLFKSWLIGRLSGRPSLAKDIWQVKGIVCCGERISGYSERIERTWGVKPLEVFGIPEAGFMAVQSWNKKGLTFIPYRNYYEFIPGPELAKRSRR